MNRKREINCSINEGITAIIGIMHKVNRIVDQSKLYQNQYPRFIFRGISKYYPENVDKNNNNKKWTEKDVEKGYIKSGLAIRMRATEKIYNQTNIYSRANFTNVLENLLYNARKYHPEKYTNWTDLDILADIQHNGGATCLVDFSKNILTAIYFACNSDLDEDGFLYCYDIIRDMVENDVLTYIKPTDEKESITSLLSQTYRTTNIISDFEARFCLWEPSPKSSRILRQDSVFLFGIEKLCVKEHGIRAFKIPAEKKPHILLALTRLFNISSGTIYNDCVGFASTNNKKSADKRLITNAYNRGFINMVKGNFDSALKFFKLWEGDRNKELTVKDKIELHFSLAVCYKNLSFERSNIEYKENAIVEYGNVVNYIHNLLSSKMKSQKEIEEIPYYRHKCVRAYSAIIDLSYETKKYWKAIDVCNKIIVDLESGILKQDINIVDNTNIRSNKINARYCKITNMELLDLVMLTYRKRYNVQETYIQQKDKMSIFYKKAKDEANSYFDKLLIEYYKTVFDILIAENEDLNFSLKRKMVKWKNKSDEIQQNMSEGYVLWNFCDIKKAIDSLEEEDLKKKIHLQYITAFVISVRDKLEMQSWGNCEKL